VRQLIEEGKPFSGLEVRFKVTSGEEVVTLASGELLEIDGESCFLWAPTISLSACEPNRL